MSFPPRFAILIDGGFLVPKLAKSLGAFPNANEIERVATDVSKHECFQGLTRLRVYFYDARPATGVCVNPIDKSTTNLASTETFSKHESLLDTLELRPDFALRLGETNTRDWKLGHRAFKSLMEKPRAIEARDLVPNIYQKGVDLRIGLDIARLALTRSIQALAVITGDSDLIPAFKFARREGLRVFLCHFRHGVKRDLKAHADRVIDVKLPGRDESRKGAKKVMSKPAAARPSRAAGS